MKKESMLKKCKKILVQGLAESVAFLVKADALPADYRLVPEGRHTGNRDVALIIQFIGENEGEIILIISRETARSFVQAISPLQEKSLPPHAEMSLIKNSLGELLNIVASKITGCFSAQTGIHRVTTPSCIFGTDLSITPRNENLPPIPIATPFGVMEFHLSLPDEKEA